jgi:hypothetical protein
MELLPWIPLHKLDKTGLSRNPNAIDVLMTNPHLICIGGISMNPKAPSSILENNLDRLSWIHVSESIADLEFLERHQDRIWWRWLSRNPAAVPLLLRNPENIDRYFFSQNPSAVPYLTQNKRFISRRDICLNPNAHETMLSKRYLFELTQNPSPTAMHIVAQNLDRLDHSSWGMLSTNPCAIPILERHPEKINWFDLSKNPAGTPLLERNLERINWINLSSNPGAIDLLKRNQHKIYWPAFSENPAIFCTP